MYVVPAPLSISPALFTFFSNEERHLCRDTLSMVEWLSVPSRRPEVHDFSFIVFPLAKAYEGFLRDYFFQAGLISKRDYEGKYFRIGRSFNPDLPNRLRDEDWIYDDVARLCSEETARDLWKAWIEGRNHLFHYYSHDRYCLTYEEAVERVWMLVDVMEKAMQCSWRERI